ncbi:MAG: hypothetical protein Q8878_05280, partial [Bacillota bacterium]|nr:hypothetical protein [Bacillota bacterium]
MKKAAFLALLILALSLFGCSGKKQANDNNSASDTGSGIVENTDNSDTDEIAVRNVVVAFGKKLQDVSLQSPNVKTDMKNSYGDLVSPELLKKWQDDPKKAPGKLVSSPWPDSIGIESVDKKEDKTYEVKGKIIEMTSAEQQSGGAAAKRDVSLEVKKDDGKWLITDVTLGEYESKAANENGSTITYKNNDYGFDFALPQS